MNTCSLSIKNTWYRLLAAAALVAVLAGPVQAMGISGQDMEKPAPAIGPSGDGLAAKLIPRGKSTSVQIFLTAQSGTLSGVRPVGFDTTSSQGVDTKNFKSGLFAMDVTGLPQGGSVHLAMRSDFFTSGTAWYVFKPSATPPWANAKAESRALEQRVWELVLTAVDGGPMDADGKADGRLTLIGGPRDSFWGYALGTLFIRFFGIFIVLGLLMVGMFTSGWIFRRLERRAAAAPAPEPAAPKPGPALAAGPAPELAAAVALALHLAANATRPREENALGAGPGPWAASGRMEMMAGRQQLYRRGPVPGVKGE